MNVFIASVENELATMNAEESWHCTKVLRKKAGDLIEIIDGTGNFYQGILELITEKVCKAKIVSGPRLQKPRPYYLHLAIAPTKNIDRIEWLLEKIVEIGIDEISFMRCHNSERITLKMERLRKIVVSAVKQSLQAKLPIIHDLKLFADVLKEKKDQNYIAHCYPSEKLEIKKLNFKNTSSLILIGPEGDFSLLEIEAAKEAEFTNISLGENRLRTETAGLLVCEAAQLLS